MVSRSLRKAIAKDTIEILEKGFYNNSDGEVISIKDCLKYAKNNSIHYQPDELEKLSTQVKEIIKNNSNSPIIEVTNETTLKAAYRVVVEEKTDNVVCLNFASAKNPGGGFLNGSKAQEESLARSSGMFPCIFQMKLMYQTNKNFRSSIYTDNMIYSPQIPFFKDDEGNLLTNYYPLSIITSPAVNRGAVEYNEPKKTHLIPEAMLSRIKKVLSVAIFHNHKTIILGAWGCGVFRNKASEMSQWFGEYLLENKLFHNAFERIIFAVYDSSKDKNVFQSFKQTFES